MYPLRRLLTVLAVCLALIATQGSATSQQAQGSATARQTQASRVALVIGNATYPDDSQSLPQPIKDAQAMAEELRRAGFEVIAGADLSKQKLTALLNSFKTKIQQGSTALVFFSGYGIKSGKQSYLLPVDARIWSEADVKRDGITIDSILADMDSAGAAVKLVIIDAARRNPFERRFRGLSTGLAPLVPPVGTLAIFSTAPDKVVNESDGANNLFLTELLKEIRTPGLSAEAILNNTQKGVARASKNEQLPWVLSTLVDDFFFYFEVPPTTPPSHDSEAVLKPGDNFKDCDTCPEMIVVPMGLFTMGSPENEQGRAETEWPQQKIRIPYRFAVGKFSVTFDEWDACVRDGGCDGYQPSDNGWGRGKWPVINVTWNNANAYTDWLSRKTGKTYRLLNEAEREYITRAGTSTPYWWGSSISPLQANYDPTEANQDGRPMPVDSFQPNPWGYYQLHGNVWEWTQDCWHYCFGGRQPRFRSSGSASSECPARILRGGSFVDPPRFLRSAYRICSAPDEATDDTGFRVARSLP